MTSRAAVGVGQTGNVDHPALVTSMCGMPLPCVASSINEEVSCSIGSACLTDREKGILRVVNEIIHTFNWRV